MPCLKMTNNNFDKQLKIKNLSMRDIYSIFRDDL